MSVGYYTRKSGSKVMKPVNREARNKVMAETIFSLFIDNNFSSSEARDILTEIKAKVIAYQGVLDRNYYQSKEKAR